MQITFKTVLIFLLIALSIDINSQTNKSKIKNNIFDASSISQNGVEILTGYSGTPNKGVLNTFSVTLPEYE